LEENNRGLDLRVLRVVLERAEAAQQTLLQGPKLRDRRRVLVDEVSLRSIPLALEERVERGQRLITQCHEIGRSEAIRGGREDARQRRRSEEGLRLTLIVDCFDCSRAAEGERLRTHCPEGGGELAGEK